MSKKATSPKPATATTNERKIGEAFQLFAYAAIADIEKDLGEYGITMLHALAQNYDNLCAENKATSLKTRFAMIDNAKQFLRLWISAAIKDLVDAAIGDMKTIENVIDELEPNKEYSVCYVLIKNANKVRGATILSAKYDTNWMSTYIENLLQIAYPNSRAICAIVAENMIRGLKYFALQFGTLAYYTKCALNAEMLIGMLINTGIDAGTITEIRSGIVAKVIKKKEPADAKKADATPDAKKADTKQDATQDAKQDEILTANIDEIASVIDDVDQI